MIVDADWVILVRQREHRYYPATRAEAEAFIARSKWEPADFEMEPYPACLVCGCLSYDKTNRCWQHKGRTPCAIEGCTKSRKFENGCYDDATWVCGTHWRQVCPPRSPLRRTYLRFYRIARKLGVEKGRWPDDLEQRYWRFFRGMIARYHRGQRGFIDVNEINRMFGWGDA